MTLIEPAHFGRNGINAFILAVGLNLVWINLSEVFRYFAFVMPMMRDSFSVVSDVAPMNISVFLIWGIWDTILVLSVCGIAWMALEKFGTTQKSIIATATGIWATIFVILWLGLFNMNLATLSILYVALPLAWLEMYVAVLLVNLSMRRRS
ncbi:hypothetical protein [Pseudovibrio sp. Tun.PSC04-5.I4]|uniref:hypothetical protein n=1 Tax=Pseudovibrio sp. Tun.PSC04-5.I4 TaxID=1798213 RepID=UPI000891F0EE|nr:hypothetical protein [Pseudovibrio sp. Tun.PSC04-5.I4]SDR10678.1 hypothetical protein SAMN04515695_2798 [Pseudovibrio sp. Tun.PSC04-5.I4]